MSDTSKILATKFTDDRFPIEWKNDEEKGLMWFYDDLHCPNPISPLYFDVGAWWDADGRWGTDCAYMYQRFWRSHRQGMDRQKHRRLCLHCRRSA